MIISIYLGIVFFHVIPEGVRELINSNKVVFQHVAGICLAIGFMGSILVYRRELIPIKSLKLNESPPNKARYPNSLVIPQFKYAQYYDSSTLHNRELENTDSLTMICCDVLLTTRRIRSPVTLFSSIRVRPPLATPQLAPITVCLRSATRIPRAAPPAHKCSGPPGPFAIWSRTVGLSLQPIRSTPHINPTCQLSRCSSGLPMLTQAPLALSGHPP